MANDDNKTPEAHLAMKQRMGERDGSGANRTAITSLSVLAQVVGWPTPQAGDVNNSRAGATGEFQSLARTVAGWPTPDVSAASGGKMASDPLAKRRPSGAKRSFSINDAAAVAGWPTPTVEASEHLHQSPAGGPPQSLALTARMAGWATPQERDAKGVDQNYSKGEINNSLPNQVAARGANTSLSPAETAKRGGLNPRLAAWLQGFPVAWCQAAIRVHRKLKTRAKPAE